MRKSPSNDIRTRDIWIQYPMLLSWMSEMAIFFFNPAIAAYLTACERCAVERNPVETNKRRNMGSKEKYLNATFVLPSLCVRCLLISFPRERQGRAINTMYHARLLLSELHTCICQGMWRTRRNHTPTRPKNPISYAPLIDVWIDWPANKKRMNKPSLKDKIYMFKSIK